MRVSLSGDAVEPGVPTGRPMWTTWACRPPGRDGAPDRPYLQGHPLMGRPGPPPSPNPKPGGPGRSNTVFFFFYRPRRSNSCSSVKVAPGPRGTRSYCQRVRFPAFGSLVYFSIYVLHIRSRPIKLAIFESRVVGASVLVLHISTKHTVSSVGQGIAS